MPQTGVVSDGCGSARQKLVINGAAELVTNGDQLFLISRSKNNFAIHREMFLGCLSRKKCMVCFSKT